MSHLCTHAFQLLRISKQNQCHKCKLDSFPIFLIVRFGILVSFRYFGFVSVRLGTRILLIGWLDALLFVSRESDFLFFFLLIKSPKGL